MLADNDTAEMQTFCETLHPATVAEALADEYSSEEVWRILSQTNIANQALIFEYFPIDWQVKLVEGTGRQHMARLIEQMSHDDRADLLRRLNPRVAESLLRLVDEADRRDIATLVKYPENSAGALMTTDYAWLPAHITAAEALDRLRCQAPDKETIYYVYVLDDQRHLLGVVSLRDLILADRQTVLSDLMEKEVVRVRATDDPEHVAQEIARYDLLAIPVVDEENRLVGIITHDDVMDVVVQEATEDVHRLGAVGPIAENYLEANFLTVWRKRVIWLACLFVAELFTFTAMAHFEDEIAKIVVLSLFIPLCISTGGNSGSQAATLIIRAMALGQVTVGDWWRVLRHELLMGLALGCALGAIGFVRAFFTPQSTLNPPSQSIIVEPLQFSWVIAQAVCIICVWGTLVGSMLPIIFKRIHVDPGVASSPFVATFVDVTGIVFYFSIAKMYLPF
ncbi:MAG: magnesium transporter [Gemmataceae bacterium]|nr:magnesium transporter [Gemmataceae bacterium]MDW8265186.1 magnesium transporter [Gemmataceae bacterium]